MLTTPSTEPETAPELPLSQRHVVAHLSELRQASNLTVLRQHVQHFQSTFADQRPEHEADVLDVPHSFMQAELTQIAEAFTLERALYYVDRLIRSITEVRSNPINDLNLNQWKTYTDLQTDSLWMVERRDSSGVHRADYWGNFIPQIPYQLMRRYTRRGDWVIDAFAGSGTTLIEAQRHGRNVLGVELQTTIAERTRQILAAEPNDHQIIRALEIGDSRTFDFAARLQAHGAQTAQLAILHPPYFDIIKFSDDQRDLSNASSVEQFLTDLGAVVTQVSAALQKGRYLALIIGDKYERGEWIPLGFRAMQVVEENGYALKSIVVKNFEQTTGKRNQKELWRYRALAGGFYVFKHEYMFVFRKR